MRLRMCTTGKIFDKIYIKAITDTFFQYVVCNQGRDKVRHEGKGEDLIFWWEGSEPFAVSPLVANPDPP